MNESVEPLFKPGISLIRNAMFICNINDEVSLWRVDDTLRVYVADSFGVWLDTEDHLMRQVDKATHAPSEVAMPMAFNTATIIARNADALAAYMGMLGGVRHP
jgi:hypothetical protein